MIAPVSLEKFREYELAAFVRVTQRKLTYGYGAKDKFCGQGLPIRYGKIDCSGFNRTLMQYAVGVPFKDYPDGSWNQCRWLAENGYQSISYNEVPTRYGVHIAFHHTNGRGADPVGHVWAVVSWPDSCHTVESYGNNGPGSRDWNTPKLLHIVDECFFIGALV
jgi:hypothetical protein